MNDQCWNEEQSPCAESSLFIKHMWDAWGNSRFLFLDRDKKRCVKWLRGKKNKKGPKMDISPRFEWEKFYQWYTPHCPFIHLFHNCLLNVWHVPRHCAKTWGSSSEQITAPAFNDHAAFRPSWPSEWWCILTSLATLSPRKWFVQPRAEALAKRSFTS